jgi:hypothetical protein
VAQLALQYSALNHCAPREAKSYFYVQYVIMQTLLSTTSTFDGNTSVVGKCTYCYADFTIFAFKSVANYET